MDNAVVEVSIAANSIGYAFRQLCHLELPTDTACAIAQRLYDQGLLKTDHTQEES